MTAIDPAPQDRSSRAQRVRLAAALLAITLALGAAARLAAHGPPPGSVGELAREFRAGGGGPVRFSGALEGTAVLEGGDGQVRMELVLGADAAPAGAPVRVPTDLVVVLDRSGSMAGEKIANARAAVRALVASLGESDRFALVAYSEGAQAVLPLRPVGADRASWLATVDAIQPEGGTDMASGLDLALALVDGARASGRAARVVLISDGLANRGDCSRAGLLARAARAARGEYALSTVGVGADFDEGLMAALADAGTGNFHFLASAAGLDAVFAAEFASTRETVASALRVAITPGPGVSVVDAAGYPLERAGAAVAFRPGPLFAGQERRIWVTLRVPPGEPGPVELGRFDLEFVREGERHRLAFETTPRVARVASPDRYFAALDRATWEQGVIVDQYNALRRSVAEKLQAGRESEAVAEVQKYRADVAGKNERVRSEAVARQLEEAAGLEKRLQDAAAGVAPMAPAETKELRALGYSVGRPGSRK